MPQSNLYFKKVNVNPKGRKTGDCAIRAIANAEGRSWYEVFDNLVALAREIASEPSSSDVVSKYLDAKYKTIPVKFVNDYGETKRLQPTIFRNRGLGKGVYVVSLAGHLTCVRNGITEDTWDCSCKCAYKIWKIS